MSEWRTRRDARFLHVGMSMSDRTVDQSRYVESRRLSRPIMRRTKGSPCLSLSKSFDSDGNRPIPGHDDAISGLAFEAVLRHETEEGADRP